MTTTTSQILPARATGQRCREIPFQIVSPATGMLRHVPLTGGLCLPRGQLIDAGDWLAEGLGGAQLPVQTEVLNRWSDGSIRWLLARFVARRIPDGRTAGVLIRPGKRAQHRCGTASLRLQDSRLSLTLRPAQQQQQQATGETSLQVVPELVDAHGRLMRQQVTDIQREVSGDVCHIFRVQIRFPQASFLQLQLRLEVWPSAELVKVETRLRNSRRARHPQGLWDLGDAGSFLFQGLSLQLRATSDESAESVGTTCVTDTAASNTVGMVRWKAETTSEVRELPASERLVIDQTGSGGPAWSSSNHATAQLPQTVSERGYSATSPAGVLRGYRSSPVVAVCDAGSRLSLAVPEFWQQFPGRLTVNNSAITVGLFPPSDHHVFELQGGEQKTLGTWISTRTPDSAFRHLDWVYHEPRLMQPSASIRQARVYSWLPESTDRGQEQSSRLVNYLQEATSERWSFAARRDRIDEYGWRHFGDVHADHEQPHYDGLGTLVSHYNNQFDLIFGGILNVAASGDPKWFDLFAPLARHVMDIDIYHTAEDRACFNGGLFWHTDHFVDAQTCTHRTYSRHNKADGASYGGGPSNEHNYTTGLLHYHFLTGSPEARESVLSLADWVLAMDDGTRTIFSVLDSGPTGLASQTVLPDFHGPGRGSGNSINALLDGWILSGEQKYLDYAETLIRRVVHPQLNCAALHLDDSEGHWSYTVCVTAIGRYLAAKLEAEQTDEMYAYARESLACIGRWMAAHEKPALTEPDRLLLPTVAWAAQEFRKANALRIAASCTDDVHEERSMRSKADELSEAAWSDLYAFDRMHLTARCLSIVMTEGLRDLFHRTCRPEYLPPPSHRFDWPAWQMFVPQKQRVKQLLKNPVKTVAAAGRLLNPQRLIQSIDALRRQF
ncbi:MAG: hypothetical protein RIK87_08860 [Fuerstiella sp.]